MTKKFEELEAKMSEAARARVAKRVEAALKEMGKTERAETGAATQQTPAAIVGELVREKITATA